MLSWPTMMPCDPAKAVEESPGPDIRHESGLPDTDQFIVAGSFLRTEVFGETLSVKSATCTVTVAVENALFAAFVQVRS